MYGEPLNPERTNFAIYMNDGKIEVALEDDEDDSNHDIREVDHPLFEMYFDNLCECLFVANYHKKLKDAKDILLSMGMTEKKDLEGNVGG